MLRQLVVVALVVALAAATDDIWAQTARTNADVDDAAREPWEHALALVTEAERTDNAVDLALLATMLVDDIQYVYHGHGECYGLAQVAACLAAEETARSAQPGGRTRQLSAARQGALHVVRMLQTTHAGQLLDVYFVHLGHDGRVRFVEHLPTVHDPVRFTWRSAPAAEAVPSA